MKGDFSRVSFDAANHFSRVLSQQGRVILDADFNEQADILLHVLRTMARDLFGPCGGPVDGGFALSFARATSGPPGVAPPPATGKLILQIGSGHYYVDGILCESDGCDYASQADYMPPLADEHGSGGDALLAWLKSPSKGQAFAIYLDVWERHITWIEQDSIREVALGLGAPDTCTRSQVVWQVKALPWDAQWDPPKCPDIPKVLMLSSTARMAARLSTGTQISDPCSIPPDAKYRGAENQLYRVEVHQGGTVGGNTSPTFKWSRDNGSVATRWLGTEKYDLIVTNARSFGPGCWVELSDDDHDLRGEPGPLAKLARVQGDRLSVDPSSIAESAIAWSAQRRIPKVRRWDQTENDSPGLNGGAISIVESANPANPTWIDLEDGIQVWFASGKTYRSGDYWLIPARVGSGGIEWKGDTHDSLLKAPRGVEHHFAPLGIINWVSGSSPQNSIDNCRICNQMSAVACGNAAVVPGGTVVPPAANPAAPPRPKRTPKPPRSPHT